MPRPSDRFVDRFEAHVGPQLAALARVQGTLVVCDLTTFSEAHGALIRHADKRGAAWLPDDALAEIDRAQAVRDVCESAVA